MLIMVLVSLLFVVLGILIKHFRWYWLISGYNTMPAEKKKNVDTHGLGNFIGSSMYVIAVILLLGGLLNHMGYWWGMMGTLFFMMLFFIYILVGAQKFDHNKRTARDRVVLTVVVAVLVLALGSSALLIYSGSRPQEVEITSEHISIKGSYGITIPIDKVKTVSLEESMPKVLAKTNGFNAGEVLKGSFRLEGIGSARLFVQCRRGPYVYIITAGGDTLIINYRDELQTKELYERLLMAVGQQAQEIY